MGFWGFGGDLFDYVPQETGGSFVLNEKCKRFLDAIPGSPRIVLIAGATRSGQGGATRLVKSQML